MLAKNKKIILLICSILLTQITFATTHIINLNPNGNWIKAAGKYFPGDTIFIKGVTTTLVFNDLQGTLKNPITIINIGQVKIIYTDYRTFGFRNCKHIILNGHGNPTIKYGFYIAKNGKSNQSAVNISNLSTDIEIFGIEIASSGFAGIMAKTNPSSKDPKAWRQNFTLQNLKIHDNYIHDTKGEGMYLGFYTYAEKNGLKAHALKNTKVYNNIIENTGWDGIQIGCGDENSEIYNNAIINAGRLNQRDQRSGMSINSGFNGKIYDNTITVYNGSGISIQPLDCAKVYNNIITSAKMGIYVQLNSTTNDSVVLNIVKNSITAPTAIMIHVKNSAILIKEIKIEKNNIKAEKEVGYNYQRFYIAPTWLKIN